jgi:hypothetical protein
MMQVIDCVQGSEAWMRARMGRPTASQFAAVLAKGEEGKSRRTYMLKLAGEILTGEPADWYVSRHMERGRVMEAEARDYYAFAQSVDPQLVGHIVNGRAGCSPDALIGKRGMLQIKTALPHILIDKLIADEFPPEHKPQCQGELWLAERDWIDLEVYWPSLPPLIKRAYRDEKFIARLASAVAAFTDELGEIVVRIRHLTDPDTLKRQLLKSLEQVK